MEWPLVRWVEDTNIVLVLFPLRVCWGTTLTLFKNRFKLNFKEQCRLVSLKSVMACGVHYGQGGLAWYGGTLRKLLSIWPPKPSICLLITEWQSYLSIEVAQAPRYWSLGINAPHKGYVMALQRAHSRGEGHHKCGDPKIFIAVKQNMVRPS